MPKFKPHKLVKDESFDSVRNRTFSKLMLKTRILPGLLLASGVAILTTQVVIPLVYFETQEQEKITSPISSSVLGVASGFSPFTFEELGLPSEQPADDQNTPEYFYITIPKLKIENARVKTNSTDLRPDTYLGHYNGSALPGEPGNAFIYGHSAFPLFYNPKNYKTIFSTLDRLEEGDTFEIAYNNRTLNYKITGKKILNPKDVDPLAKIKPGYLNDSTVVLMSCWPAGTKTKRILIEAELVD